MTQTEAGRWEERREEHEEQARQLRQAVIDAYRARGQEPPATIAVAAESQKPA